MTVLDLESLESSIFELDFSIFKKKRVSTVKPSQEDDFFLHGNDIFFRDSCSFLCIKALLKVSDPFFRKKSDIL